METARMVLRPLTADDLDDLVELCADPAVMRFLNGGQPVGREVLAAELTTRPDRLGAFLTRTGEFLGWFKLRVSDTGAEIGYRLRRDAWGQGLATEGSRWLCDHAFTALGVERVWAKAHGENLASRRVMEKVGLRPLPDERYYRAELRRDDWIAERTLRTPRMRLRPLTLHQSDVDLCYELDNDPEVMRYLNGGRPRTRAEVVEKLNAGRGRLAAFQDDEFMGWIFLKPTGPDEAELGYRLHQRFWGQGFATEGSRFLIRHAFEVVGVRRVWAQTMTVNTRSRRVMEKVGLRYVRTFHAEWDDEIEGGELGDVEYELLREDWVP